MSSETDDRIDELITLAALGELTDEQQAELDAALIADAERRDELDADLATAAQLQSTTPVQPPASTRDEVLDAIAGIEQNSANTEDADDHVPPTPSTVSPVTEIDRGRRRRWQPLAAAAAVAMLLVGGIVVGTRDSDQSRFDAVAEASDAQRRTLDGTLTGTIDIVWSPSEAVFALAGTDIPTLPDTETYQLWFVDDDGATPVGLFQPNEDGVVELIFDDLDPSDVLVGVTIEPAGGSQSPTLPIVAAA